MTKYAAQTDVSSQRSRDEIERILTRYGADQFIYGWKDEAAVIGFRAHNRHIKFTLPLPSRDGHEFTHRHRGAAGIQLRSDKERENVWQRAIRSKWRALVLVIKAKLEAVESGITVFEEEFLAHIVLPDGSTVGEHMLPQIEHAYQSGTMPPLLPNYSGQ